MEIWLISGLRQGKKKMTPEHLILKYKEYSKNNGNMSKGHRNQLEKAPLAKYEAICVAINDSNKS